jgi:hypothetical protein
LGADVAKSAASGLASGAAALVGLPGDIARGAAWLREKAGRAVWGDEAVERAKRELAGNPLEQFMTQTLPTGADVTKAMEENVTGELYKPQTITGKYARTAASFVPAAVAGPGNAVRNAVAYGLVPGVASEAAGDLAQNYAPSTEPYARAIGALLGAGAGGAALRPGTAGEAVSAAMRDVTRQDIDAAAQLMAAAQTRGVQLTWPEAIQQVTNGRGQALGNLQRVAEGASPGGPLQTTMAARPAQVEEAWRRQMVETQGGAPNMNPSAIGPRAAEAATAEIEAARQAVNAATRNLYRQAGRQRVSRRELARLHRVPGFSEALTAVRADPQLNRRIANLSDNNVLVLDAVKRRLQQQAENAASVTNPFRDVTASAGAEQSARAVRQSATQASQPLRQALDRQAQLRQARVQPLQEGQMGRIANAGDTEAAGLALLPTAPLPGTAAETGRTVGALAARDPRTTQNLVRSELDRRFAIAAKDLQAGANQWAGAAARKALVGHQQLARNIRSALRELPNGPEIARGFDELMTIFAATGRRQHIGSQTAFNAEQIAQLKRAGVIEETVRGGLVLRIPSAIRDRYEAWRLGRSLDDLGRIFTDPNGRQRLLELERLPRHSPRRYLLAGQIASNLAHDVTGETP